HSPRLRCGIFPLARGFGNFQVLLGKDFPTDPIAREINRFERFQTGSMNGHHGGFTALDRGGLESDDRGNGLKIGLDRQAEKGRESQQNCECRDESFHFQPRFDMVDGTGRVGHPSYSIAYPCLEGPNNPFNQTLKNFLIFSLIRSMG
ncbi:MAG: hypothetical protein KJS91_11885, partial [Planctomycetes bacterium]|nr:hypothetical protein [Planctomycetota bacterium]